MRGEVFFLDYKIYLGLFAYSFYFTMIRFENLTNFLDKDIGGLNKKLDRYYGCHHPHTSSAACTLSSVTQPTSTLYLFLYISL